MNAATTTMHLLVLHTDEAIRHFMPDLLRLWLSKSSRPRACKIQVEDGNSLDYPRVVSLLKDGFDCIMVNLRLPAMLSVRIAELVHRAKVPARLVLVSGAPQDLGPALSLYDGYIQFHFHYRAMNEEPLHNWTGKRARRGPDPYGDMSL